MSTHDLLADLRARGFTVTAEAANLRVSPRERLTDDLRAELRTQKADLLALLTAEAVDGLSDDAYYALVDSDIRQFGYYRADRPYAREGTAR